MNKFKKRKIYKKYSARRGTALGTKMIKAIMKPEKKYVDIPFLVGLTPGAPGVLELVSGIRRGTSINQRVGNKVQLVGMMMKYAVVQPTDMQVANNVAYIGFGLEINITQVKSPNGAAYSAVQFKDITNITEYFYAPRRINGSKFKNLYSKDLEVDGVHGECNVVETYIPLNMEVLYNADTGATTDVTQNSMYLCYYPADSTKYSGSGVTRTEMICYFRGAIRLFYIDL